MSVSIVRKALHQIGDVIVDASKQTLSDRYRIIDIFAEGNSGTTYAADYTSSNF